VKDSRDTNENRLALLMGGVDFQPRDSNLAMQMLDSVYRSLPSKTSADLEERYLLTAQFAYGTARNFHKALLYSDTLISLLEGSDPESSIYLEATLQRGDILVALSRYDEAFTMFYQAKQLVINQNDPCVLPNYTIRLANVSNKQKRYREAAGFFRQVLQELESCSDTSFRHFSDVQGNLDNIGVMYSRINWLDSAAYYYDLALDYIAKNEARYPHRKNFMGIARSVIYGNQGDIAARRGRPEEAKKLFRESIAFNIQRGHAPEDAAYNLIKLADIYLRQKEFDSIGLWLRQVDSIRMHFPNPELKSRYFDIRSRYALATGDTSGAYRFLSSKMTLYDSVLLPSMSNPSIAVGEALAQVSRQYRLENANRRKNDYLVIGAFGLAMLLVIMGLLWFNYRRSSKSVDALNALNRNMSEKNAELLETLEKLERMRRDKRHLMHVVAHDLRSPVGSITTLAKLIRQGQVDGNSMDDVMDMIIKAGTSAQSLITQLLEERARETKGHHISVHMDEVLRYVAGILQYKASEKQQLIHLELFPVSLISDREKLQRIFHNLVDNAIKFSPHGSEVRIEMERINDKLQVRITDHGIGIPEGERGSFMDEVASLKRMGTYGEASYGLGLSIVWQLVRETEGRIWYASTEGQGTTFYLEYLLP
jgi:signal transduction histidine kinase